MLRRAWLLSLALAAALAAPASSADQKLLTNMRGDVAYQRGAAMPKSLAPSARVALTDGDSAQTSSDSIGRIVLSDATTITIGENSNVKMDWFHAGMAPDAKFTVNSGKVRFNVVHPSNQPSNYTFKTPTGQIAVRGTIGDIGIDSDDEIRLNIYQTGFAHLPVIVKFRTGQIYTVHAGQTLEGSYVGGELQVAVHVIDQAAIDFFGQFGSAAAPAPPMGTQNSISTEPPKK